MARIAALAGLTRMAALTATALIALFAVAASAQAATYYVTGSGSGAVCTQAQPCATILDALQAHRLAPTASDVIDVGPGVFEGFDASDPADAGLTIRGTLTGATRDTTIRPLAGSIGFFGVTALIGVCPSVGAGVTLRDANIDTHGADAATGALEMDGDSTLVNVHAENQPGSTAGSVVDACEGQATITASQIVAGNGDFGIVVNDRLTLTDSTVEATDSLAILQWPGPPNRPIIVKRSRISTTPFAGGDIQTASDLTIDSSLLTGGAQGVVVSDSGATVIRNTTIDIGDPGFDGLYPGVSIDNGLSGGPATVTIDSSILVDALVDGGGGSGTVTCRYSDLPQPDPPGPGLTFDCDTGPGTTNTSTAASLLFVGGSPFSWQLVPGGPAVDAGDPAGLAPGQSATDLLGHARVLHGTTASCPSGVRDMGAYEAADVVCPPAVLVAPVVERSSAPFVGTKLGAYAGSWSGAPTSYGFQWVRCDADGTSNCADVPGRTHSTYTPAAADLDHTLRVRVVASNADGDSNPATSAPSGVVALPPPGLLEAPTVERSSAPKVGTKLGAYRGGWSYSPTSYAFQWLRCDTDGVSNCADIAGRTNSAYIPVAADVDHRLRVRVVATNAGGSTPAASAPSGVVALPAPTLVQPPVIERSSAPAVGVKLGTYSGAWSPSVDSYQRQWLRCDGPQVSDCTAIAGRTGSTYIPVSADVGKRLRVRVMAVNGGGSSTPAISAPSGVVG